MIPHMIPHIEHEFGPFWPLLAFSFCQYRITRCSYPESQVQLRGRCNVTAFPGVFVVMGIFVLEVWGTKKRRSRSQQRHGMQAAWPRDRAVSESSGSGWGSNEHRSCKIFQKASVSSRSRMPYSAAPDTVAARVTGCCKAMHEAAATLL
jgi:hypothetical protein